MRLTTLFAILAMLCEILWAAPAGALAAQPPSGTQVNPQLWVSETDSLVRVGNGVYQLTFDKAHGGALVELQFEKSGHRLGVQMLDAMNRNYQLAQNPLARAALANLELEDENGTKSKAIQLEVRAALIQEGVARDFSPQVIYRYTFVAGSPLVSYEVILPEQAVHERITRSQLLSFQFNEPQFFLEQTNRLLLNAEDAFGVAKGLFDSYSLERDKQQLTVLSRTGRLDGRTQPWTGEELRWLGCLFIGPRSLVTANWPVDPLRAGQFKPNLAGQMAETRECLSQACQRLTNGVTPASLVAADMLLHVANEVGSEDHDWDLESMLAASRSLATGNDASPPLVVVEKNTFLALCNRQTGLLFRRNEHTASLEAIYHAGRHLNFIRPGSAFASFWRARFRDHGTDQWLELASCRATRLRCETAQQPDGTVRLTMVWPGQRVAGDEVEVQVVVSLLPDDPQARWRMNVVPRGSSLGLWEVDFPLLQQVKPDRTRGTRDFLAYPFHSGYLLENPAQNSPPAESALYPGSAGWQFLAYWQDQAGLYYGVHDGKGHLKRFRVEPNGDGTFRMQATHLPESMGEKGAAFVMPYDCVVGTYDGDWFDGTMIYREWLLQQEWFPRQTLFTNDRLPRWFKESSLCYRAFTGSKGQKVKPAVQPYLDLQKILDAPATLIWYGWNDSKPHMAGRPDLRPAEGFPEIITRMRRHGIEVFPYTCALLWDVRNPSYKNEGGEAASMRTLDGDVYMARYGDQPLAMVSPAHPAYQDKMVRFMREALSQMEARGVYFDMAGTSPGGFYMAAGEKMGGNLRTLGFRDLMRRYKEVALKHDPQFVLSMEGNADCYLDHVDSYIAFLSNLPIRMALYADYQRPYGSKDCEWEPPPNELFHPARQFAWGAPIGRIDAGDLLKDGQLQQVKLDYYQKLVRLRNAALPWLAYGRMLRSLPIFNVTPPEPLSLSDGQTIPTGTWQAPDGTVAFAFANARYSVPATTFHFTLNPASYEIPADGSHALYRIVAGDRKAKSRCEFVQSIQGVVERTVTLPAADVLVLVALPPNHKLLGEDQGAQSSAPR